jgi:KUP system potassium uptake protein
MSHLTTEFQKDHGKLRVLIIGAIGVVFGDIGTSPLYAFKESFLGQSHFAADDQHVLNILSLIFWSVMISVSLKYVTLMMRADNKGEGGSLSLLALASRVSHETKWVAMLIPILGIFAAALFYGDSMITPAISVLSAVEGLKVISPAFDHLVLPITLVILAFLFAFQRLGTEDIGIFFGPIMCVWFLVLSILGIVNIAGNPHVLAAINPYYAVNFFLTDHWFAFLTLGSVVLAMTGAEALYADMGHFGKSPIRIGWTAIIFPSLMLNYFGQGAFVLANPEGIENPFFMMAPDWMEPALVVLATLATIIASQAVISGAFSVTRQAIQLGYLPRMQIIHTSNDQMGQIYIPFINWMLLIFVYMLVLGFKTSTNLAHAYGVAVTGTMLIDTILLSVVIFKMWNWKRSHAIPLVAVLMFVDLSFFLATSMKIVHGGWFPLALGLIVFILLTTWKKGRSLLFGKLRKDSMKIEVFFRDVCDTLPHVPGTAIFMSNLENGIPPAMILNLRHNKIIHERNIFLHVVVEEKSYVRIKDRLQVLDLGHDFYWITLRYGFKDDLNIPAEMDRLPSYGIPFVPDDTTYFVGKETIISTDLPGMARWREHLFAWMTRNASSAADYYKLPSKRVMELGSRVDI